MSLKQRLSEAPNPNLLLEVQLQEAQLQLQADRNATQRELIKAKESLRIAYSTMPYAPKLIIEWKGKVSTLEAGLKALDELEAEDFPKESPTLKKSK